MLNKEVCKKCLKERVEACIEACPKEREKYAKFYWDDENETKWNRGSVICCPHPVQLSVKDKPPFECPYYLEHILENQTL